MPFDNTCYLAILYGPDFMTPKKEFKTKKLVGARRGDRFNHPCCNKKLSCNEIHELEQQLSFSNMSYSIWEEGTGLW